MPASDHDGFILRERLSVPDTVLHGAVEGIIPCLPLHRFVGIGDHFGAPQMVVIHKA